ncbi:LOW QUALITY PROTEIN: hypothetical protein NC651_017135 [Populus alba x Populus x berolinensis]|nr:LOW QUALITY PROTEIN: hypothetical protein NC651_017135 [Populus alba x Populus x berolinensis]
MDGDFGVSKKGFVVMLRKRTRSLQKDQQMGQLTMSDSGSDLITWGTITKPTPFFTVPGLFVGSSLKGLSDCDSVRSPTSPLDFRMFSNIGNPSKSPRSSHGGQRKSWDCNKVGLSIVDSLDDDGKGSGKVLRSSESKNILFGPRVRSKTLTFNPVLILFKNRSLCQEILQFFPRTLTKSPLLKGSSDVLFEIGEDPSDSEPFGKIRSCSLDSCRSFSSLSRLAGQNSKASSGNFCLDNVTPMRMSSIIRRKPKFKQLFKHKFDFYPNVGYLWQRIYRFSLCKLSFLRIIHVVISHGPNPKTTHIYGDCILECQSNDLSNFGKNEAKEIGLPQAVTCSKIPGSFPSKVFLSFCYYCNKKLDEGKDIYIYRGEKAFCSLSMPFRGDHD